jgi:hypothetical protein
MRIRNTCNYTQYLIPIILLFDTKNSKIVSWEQTEWSRLDFSLQKARNINSGKRNEVQRVRILTKEGVQK